MLSVERLPLALTATAARSLVCIEGEDGTVRGAVPDVEEKSTFVTEAVENDAVVSFSSDENFRRVLRRISRTTASEDCFFSVDI